MNSVLPNCTILDEEKNKEFFKLFRCEKPGWVQVGEKKWILPFKYVKEREGYYNFKAISTDTWVITHPRSGTTWMCELVWLLSNNLDFNTATTKQLFERFRFLEINLLHHPKATENLINLDNNNFETNKLPTNMTRPGYQTLETLNSPRFIKSHLPLSLLPNVLNSDCKIVYVARNPKDVVVSWFLFHQGDEILKYTGDFSTFWRYFKNNMIIWSPYWDHVKEAWAVKNQPNVLFMFYEELHADLLSSVKKIANFLGKIYRENQLLELVDHLSFKNFKSNPMVNGDVLCDLKLISQKGTFVREGKIGGWKEYFTEEMEKEANEWIIQNLKDTDLVFPIDNLIN